MEDNNTKFYVRAAVVLVIVAALAIVGFAVMSRYSSSNKKVSSVPTVDTSAAAPAANNIPAATVDKIFLKTDQGSVEVNNFYKKPHQQVRNIGKIVPFAHTPDYSVYYQYEGNYFTIVINGKPYAQTRPEAENVLLEILGISREDACKLPVEVSIPEFNDPNSNKTVNFGLSFCPDSLPVQ